jgi:hypothetical protein
MILARYYTLLTLEGVLLSGAGLAHIIFMLNFVDFGATDPAMYFGALVIGAAYFVFGVSFLSDSKRFLIPALVLNVLGLFGASAAGETSPLWAIDPYLITLDLVSIPLLIFLVLHRNKAAK